MTDSYEGKGVFTVCLHGVSLTDLLKTEEEASGLDPCCVCVHVCVRVYYIWRGHWVMITQGNLKAWMWVVGNVFCFIEITFHNPDDTERLRWSYASWYRDVMCVEMWLKRFKEFCFSRCVMKWIFLFQMLEFSCFVFVKKKNDCFEGDVVNAWCCPTLVFGSCDNSFHCRGWTAVNTHAPEPKIKYSLRPLRNWHSWPESNILNLHSYENEFCFVFFTFILLLSTPMFVIGTNKSD